MSFTIRERSHGLVLGVVLPSLVACSGAQLTHPQVPATRDDETAGVAPDVPSENEAVTPSDAETSAASSADPAAPSVEGLAEKGDDSAETAETGGDPANGRPLVRGGGVSLESVYRPGELELPASARERRERLAEIERWNHGGFSDERKWHPVPRVVIGEPTVRAGKIDGRATLRTLRAEQYGAVRRCFDAALRDEPELSGRTVLSLKIRGDRVSEAHVATGRTGVSDSRKFPKVMTSKVATCLASAFGGIHVPRAKTAGATVLVPIDLWPGDAPLPDEARASTGKISMDAARASMEAQRSNIVACVAPRDGAVAAWGRLALEVEVTAEGGIQAVREVESTFPERGAAACVAKAMSGQKLTAPTPTGSTARIVVAFRVAPR